jgi:hypothetical protein
MGAAAEITVLHVQKSGLHIRQTGMYVFRDQKFYSIVTEHRLFHFRVKEHDAHGRFPYVRGAGLTRPPAAWATHYATGRSLLWSWNEERWYVRLEYSRLYMFTNPLPPELAEFLDQVQRLPVEAGSSLTQRDICLGLRYDPLAELGALTSEEREALLRLR